MTLIMSPPELMESGIVKIPDGDQIVEEPPGIFSGDCSQATPIDEPELICGGLSIKPPGILDGGIVEISMIV